MKQIAWYSTLCGAGINHGFSPAVSHDGRHLVIEVWHGTDDRNQVVHQNLSDPDAQPDMLVSGFDAGYTFIGALDGTLYFLTNADAPNGRIVARAPAVRLGRP